MAFVAGGAGEPAIGPAFRLALAMLTIQLSIGALNDLVDADLDRGRKPGKPIPRAVIGRAEAWAIVVAGLGLGIVLSAASSLTTAAVAGVGAALGYAYDVRLSRTAWSWLPLALALPLLPIFAWLGATGTVPGALWLLVPVGALAGLGLALGNGLADFDRDVSAGVATAAQRLGRGGAWRVGALALAGVVVAALALAPRIPGAGGLVLLGWIVALKGGSVVVLAGVVLTGAAGPARASLRERGWELEAAGVALVGVAWLAGIANPSG